jgi:hypothetical protein
MGKNMLPAGSISHYHSISMAWPTSNFNGTQCAVLHRQVRQVHSAACALTKSALHCQLAPMV